MAKLRGTKDDLISVKQKNNELKDRVQVLESKLFDALSYNQQVSSKKKSKPNAADDNDNQEDDGVTTVTTTANVAALELQCQQLQRLNAQLEYKVRELQAKEKNSKSKILKSNQAIDPTSTKEAATFIDKLVANVGFGVTLGPSSLSSLQKIFAADMAKLNQKYACLWNREQIDRWSYDRINTKPPTFSTPTTEP
jgi:carbamoylphosphate synthase small subunit